MHWIDPDSLKESRHRVRLFLLNEHGDVDGFVSTKGVQVHVPPHMGTALTSAVSVGQRIGIRGLRPKGADVLAAVALEPKQGDRVVDEGPSSHSPKSKTKTKAAHAEIEGTTERPLYAPQGECVGLLFTNGIGVRIDPEMADELAEFLIPGALVAVEGKLRTNPWGTVMDAEYLWSVDSPSEDQPAGSDPVSDRPSDH